MKNKRVKVLIAMVSVLFMFAGNAVCSKAQNDEQSDGGLKPMELIEIDESYDASNETVYASGDDVGDSEVYRLDWDKYGDDYCYNNLDTYKQSLYDEMKEACTEYMNTRKDAVALTVGGTRMYGIGPISYSGLTTAELTSLVYTFIYQNPEFYYLMNGVLYNSRIFYIKVYDAFADGDDRSDVSAQMFAVIDNWVAQTAAESTQLDKEKKAHDLICEYVVYEEGDYDQTAYSVVMQQKTVCAGYTKAYSMVSNAAGLRTVSVTSETHGWNRTKIGNRWYNVDLTWDDGTPILYRYFNKSDATMRQYDGSSRESHTQNSYYDGIAPECPADYDLDAPAVETPSPVANLKATAAGKNKVLLTWDVVDSDAKYLIYAMKNGVYGYCGMTSSNQYTDTKALDADYNFYWVYPYRVDANAYNIVGKCPQYVYAKGACASVTNLKAYSQKGGVKLTWTKSTGAQGYLIYGKNTNGTYHYIGMTQKTSYVDTKASKSSYNFYWVFPYHYASSGKMVVGPISKTYVYGKAK